MDIPEIIQQKSDRDLTTLIWSYCQRAIISKLTVQEEMYLKWLQLELEIRNRMNNVNEIISIE